MDNRRRRWCVRLRGKLAWNGRDYQSSSCCEHKMELKGAKRGLIQSLCTEVQTSSWSAVNCRIWKENLPATFQSTSNKCKGSMNLTQYQGSCSSHQSIYCFWTPWIPLLRTVFRLQEISIGDVQSSVYPAFCLGTPPISRISEDSTTKKFCISIRLCAVDLQLFDSSIQLVSPRCRI